MFIICVGICMYLLTNHNYLMVDTSQNNKYYDITDLQCPPHDEMNYV